MSSDPAISTEAAWCATLLQAGDSFYPTGSYAHSFGLEGLVDEQVVRDADSLRTHFFETVLPALARMELPLAAQSYRALAAGDWVTVVELSELASALKATREAREASAKIGQQRIEMLGRLYPDSVAVEFHERAKRDGWPFAATISAAVEGRVHGAPLGAVLGGIVYATLSAQLAAAMKVLRLGQNAAQSILTAALAETPQVVATALTVERDDIGWFNPWLDIASARHETAAARMFIS
jgi:urease accessory protein